ncbi:AAA family ATPase [Bacteroides ovatus]|nr:AAA family ATPase [Bacteroides ovatus]
MAFSRQGGVKQENIYEIFQDEYNQYYKEWTIYIDQYRDTIDFLISQLQERYNDIFTPREISNIVDCSENIIEIINRFNSLLQKNKNKSSTIAKDKDIYRRELRYSEIQSFIKTIEYERICKDWKNEEKSINSEEKKT